MNYPSFHQSLYCLVSLFACAAFCSPSPLVVDTKRWDAFSIYCFIHPFVAYPPYLTLSTKPQRPNSRSLCIVLYCPVLELSVLYCYCMYCMYVPLSLSLSLFIYLRLRLVCVCVRKCVACVGRGVMG